MGVDSITAGGVADVRRILRDLLAVAGPWASSAGCRLDGSIESGAVRLRLIEQEGQGSSVEVFVAGRGSLAPGGWHYSWSGPSIELRVRVPDDLRLRFAPYALESLTRRLRLALEIRERAGGREGSKEAVILGSQEVPAPEGVENILRVNFACNQRCPFCFVDLNGRRASLEEIERQLERLRRERPNESTLTISGGEPAADPRLLDILDLARRQGFREFQLQTNAVPLSKPGKVQPLVDRGVGFFFVSFHAHESRAYDLITASRGQFGSALQGIRNILEARGEHRTVFNIVVNRLNVERLPQHIAFLRELVGPRAGWRGVVFSMMNMSVGMQAAPMAVRLSDAVPRLREALRTCRDLGFWVGPFGGDCGFPLCALDEPASYAPQHDVSRDDVKYMDSYGSVDWRGRAKSPACRACVHDRRCRGVSIGYAKLYGVGELRPFRGTEE
jgi:hypothetical protein